MCSGALQKRGRGRGQRPLGGVLGLVVPLLLWLFPPWWAGLFGLSWLARLSCPALWAGLFGLPWLAR